jgi:hypothetical protein
VKKLTLLLPIAISTSLFAKELPPMPPMGGFLKSSQKFELPKSCKVIPPMLRHLPPPMEKDFETCRSELHKPVDSKLSKFISKNIGKDAKLKSVEVLYEFNELYKVTYTTGKEDKILFCNKKATKCIRGDSIIGE